MSLTGSGTRMRRSYLSAALLHRETWVAAFVTVCAALVVAMIGSRPLASEFRIDLREGDHLRGLAQATLIGFSFPTDFGRDIVADRALMVTNRPLPDIFDLEVEGRAAERGAAVRVDIVVGEFVRSVTFDEQVTRHRFQVRNPQALRTIVFRTMSGKRVSVLQISVRPGRSIG